MTKDAKISIEQRAKSREHRENQELEGVSNLLKFELQTTPLLYALCCRYSIFGS